MSLSTRRKRLNKRRHTKTTNLQQIRILKDTNLYLKLEHPNCKSFQSTHIIEVCNSSLQYL